MFALFGIVVLPASALLLILWLDSLAEPVIPSTLDLERGTMRRGAFTFEGLISRVRPWHVVASLALSGLVVAGLMSRRGGEPFLFLAALLTLVLFLRVWGHAFVGLMTTPDDAFPGRHDKLVWALLLVLLPPVGLACLRKYRRVVLHAVKQARAETGSTADGFRAEPPMAAFDDLA